MKKRKPDSIKIYFKIYLRNLFSFLKSRINFKTYVILASTGVGILSGLAAVLLKHLVRFFQEKPSGLLTEHGLQFLLPISPFIGIVLSVLAINLFWRGTIYKSLSRIILFWGCPSVFWK